jgi:hypothetical protein
MSNVVSLRPHAPRPVVDDTIRADCERLMRMARTYKPSRQAA